jgi:hypothetical protein
MLKMVRASLALTTATACIARMPYARRAEQDSTGLKATSGCGATAIRRWLVIWGAAKSRSTLVRARLQAAPNRNAGGVIRA